MGRRCCCGCRDKFFGSAGDWDSIQPAPLPDPPNGGAPSVSFAVNSGMIFTGTIPIRDAAEISVVSDGFVGSLVLWIHYEVDGAGDPVPGTGIRQVMSDSDWGGLGGTGNTTAPNLYFAPDYHLFNRPSIRVNLDNPQPPHNGRIRLEILGTGFLRVEFIDGTRTFEPGYGGALLEDCGGRWERFCGDPDEGFLTAAAAPNIITRIPAHDPACSPPSLGLPWPYSGTLPWNGGVGLGLGSCQSLFYGWSMDGSGCTDVNAAIHYHQVIPPPTAIDPYPAPVFQLTATATILVANALADIAVFNLPTEDLSGVYEVTTTAGGFTATARWTL